jgi:hypothetical protein
MKSSMPVDFLIREDPISSNLRLGVAWIALAAYGKKARFVSGHRFSDAVSILF